VVVGKTAYAAIGLSGSFRTRQVPTMVAALRDAAGQIDRDEKERP
jgi:hypothetical protein